MFCIFIVTQDIQDAIQYKNGSHFSAIAFFIWGGVMALNRQGRRQVWGSRGPDLPASNRTTHRIRANPIYLDGKVGVGVAAVNRQPVDLDPSSSENLVLPLSTEHKKYNL